MDYLAKGLKPGVSYSVQVRSQQDGHFSPWSPTFTFTAPLPPAPTQTPTVVLAAQSLGYTVNISGQASVYDYGGTRIYASTSSGFTPGVGNLVAVTTDTIQTINNASFVPIYVKTSFVDAWGQEGPFSTQQSVTPINPVIVDTTAPTVPTAGFSSSSVADTKDVSGQTSIITVNWTGVADTDLTGYKIKFGLTNNSASAGNVIDLPSTPGASARSAIFYGVAGQTYYWWVASYDNLNNVSAWSATQTMTAAGDATAPAIPTSPTFVARPATESLIAAFTWTAPATTSDFNPGLGIGYYEAMIASDSGFTANVQTTRSQTPNAVFNVPLWSTTYYAKVRAVDTSGNASAYTSNISQAVGADPAMTTASSAFSIANGKNTIYYAANASPPSAGATGDTWFVTDQDYKIRRATAVGSGSWSDSPLGNSAIATSGISASKLTTGTLNVERILAGTMDVAKLTVSARQNANAVPNGSFEDLDGSGNIRLFTLDSSAGYIGSTYASVTTAANVYSGTRSLSMTKGGTGTNSRAYMSEPIATQAGEIWYASTTAKHDVANGLISVSAYCYDNAQAFITAVSAYSAAPTATGFTVYGGQLVIPANTRWVRFAVNRQWGAGSTVCYIDNLFAERAIVTSSIVANAITANELAANSVVAGKIAAGTITANEIASGTITADKITIGMRTMGENAIVGGSFEDIPTGPLALDFHTTYGWVTTATAGTVTWAVDSTISASGTKSLKTVVDNGGTSRVHSIDSVAWAVPVVAGQKWYMEATYRADVAGSGFTPTLNAFYYDGAMAWVGGASTVLAAPTTAFQSQGTIFTVPAGVAYMIWLLDTVNTSGSQRTLWVDNAVVKRAVGGVVIEDDAISAGKIQADAISADKISTGLRTVGENSHPNGGFESGDLGWTLQQTGAGYVCTWSIDSTVRASGSKSAKAVVTVGNSARLYGWNTAEWMTPVVPGQTWYVEGTYKADAAAAGFVAYMRPHYYDASLTYVSSENITLTAPTASWQTDGRIVTIPANAAYMIWLMDFSNSSAGTRTLWVDNTITKRATAGVMIQDDAISAGKIQAGAIIAGKIAAGSIVAGDIAANTITASKISTDTSFISQALRIGGTAATQINFVAGVTAVAGKIYSGSSGVFNNTSTGFYLDGDGNFSLKDKLSFNGTSLTVNGTIQATGGYFSGNMAVGSGGTMKLGVGVSGTNSGLYIAPNNYWYNDGSFSIGNPNGIGQRLNIYTNPNLESNTVTGHGGANSATISTSTTQKYQGTYSMLVTCGATVAQQGGYAIFTNLAANTYYTVSGYLYNPTTNGIASGVFLSVQGAGVAGPSDSAVTNIRDSWVRVSTTFQTNATPASGVIPYFISAGNPTAGTIFYIDAMLLELGTSLNPYFDGNTFGAAWTGTANLSTSSAIGGAIDWDGITFFVDGNITARSGTFNGNVEIQNGGSLFAKGGAAVPGTPGTLTGQRVVLNYQGVQGISSASIPQFTLSATGPSHIGPWFFDHNRLTGGSGGSEVGLAVSGPASFWAGGTSGAAPFRVSPTGQMFASSANISGNITASSGSIAGVSIITAFPALPNGDFESAIDTGADNWNSFWKGAGTTVTLAAGEGEGGTYAYKAVVPVSIGSTMEWTGTIPVVPGETYTLTARVKASAVLTNSIIVGLLAGPTAFHTKFFDSLASWTATEYAIANSATSYTTYTKAYTVPAGKYFIRPVVQMGMEGTASIRTFWIDNVTLTRSGSFNALVSGTGLPGSETMKFIIADSGIISTTSKMAAIPGKFAMQGEISATSLEGSSMRAVEYKSLAAVSVAANQTTYGVAPDAGSGLGTTFVAPVSGCVLILTSAILQSQDAATVVSYEVRTGGTLGSGTIIVAAATENGAYASGGAGGVEVMNTSGFQSNYVSGLTPNATYNIRFMNYNADTVTRTVQYRKLTIIPQL